MQYALIGGLAVRAHSIPRPTWDLDLIAAIDQSLLPIVLAALARSGYDASDPNLDGRLNELEKPPLIQFAAVLPKGSIDVDIFLAVHPFQRELLQRRQLAVTTAGELWVATPEDLILLKLLSNRNRDLADVADILFMQRDLNEMHMRLWAERFGILDRLNDQLANRPTERP